MFTEQALAAILGFALAIIFIRTPARKGAKRDRVPWYDAIFAAASLIAAFYLTWLYPSLIDQFYFMRDQAFAVGLVLVPLTIEALRRTSGWGLTGIVLAFVVYGLWGDVVPGKLEARAHSFYDLASYLAVDTNGILGLPMTIICTVVIMYVFFGQLLLKTGGSEWFTDIATALMGGTRGGSAKIAIVASGLFGSISGSAVSNVVSTGVITIPLMRQAGYDAKTAGAFEAVASTGGQIMPPIMGAAAFLMAEILQVPYSTVVIAAIVPALLYYVAVFIFADLEAARKNIAPVPPDQIPPFFRVIREGWFFLIPFAVLIYQLFIGNLAPEEAALWGAGAIVGVSWIFGYKGKRIGPRGIYESIRDTGATAVDIITIGAMAGIIIGVIQVSGLGFGLTFVLVQFGQGNLAGLLALTAVICIILGMGMPTTAVYLLVAVLAAPPLIQLHILPIAAHMFVFYFGIVSLITPPVAVAAYVAASLSRGRRDGDRTHLGQDRVDRARGAGDVRHVTRSDHAGHGLQFGHRVRDGGRGRVARHRGSSRTFPAADGVGAARAVRLRRHRAAGAGARLPRRRRARARRHRAGRRTAGERVLAAPPAPRGGSGRLSAVGSTSPSGIRRSRGRTGGPRGSPRRPATGRAACRPPRRPCRPRCGSR